MKTINKQLFYNYINVNLFDYNVDQAIYDNTAKLLKSFSETGIEDCRFLAYILATVFHESGKAMTHEPDLVNAMLTGTLTGKPLSKYLTLEKTDFVNCQRSYKKRDDSAKIVAGYAYTFVNALNRDK